MGWDGKERRKGGNNEELRSRVEQMRRKWESQQPHKKTQKQKQLRKTLVTK
jgi:hypothetical protein